MRAEWRPAPSDSHAVLAYPFRLNATRPTNRPSPRALVQTDDWTHWLQPLATAATTTTSETQDEARATLRAIHSDSYFFLDHIRKYIYPDFDQVRLGDTNDDVDEAIKGVDHQARIISSITLKDWPHRVVRLRYIGHLMPKSLHVTSGDSEASFSVTVEYVDICMFEDDLAILLVKFGQFKQPSGGELNTLEIGAAVRCLRRLHGRIRNLTDAPTFSTGDGDDTKPIGRWQELLDPVLTQLTDSIGRDSAISSDSSFRAIITSAIPRFSDLKRPDDTGLFRTLADRSLFELGTGHDTLQHQSQPTAVRVEEVTQRIIRQWESFESLVFWENATFVATDRSVELGSRRKFAMDIHPAQVENNYVWLFVLCLYQEATARRFIENLEVLAANRRVERAKVAGIADSFVRFRSKYWHRELTGSESGGAVHEAMTQMFNLAELNSAVSAQIDSAVAHFESQEATREAWRQNITQFLVASVTFVAIPFAALQGALLPGDIRKHMYSWIESNRGVAWLVFVGGMGAIFYLLYRMPGLLEAWHSRSPVRSGARLLAAWTKAKLSHMVNATTKHGRRIASGATRLALRRRD